MANDERTPCQATAVAVFREGLLTAYLADLLDRIHDHKINRLDELLPWNWTADAAQDRAA